MRVTTRRYTLDAHEDLAAVEPVQETPRHDQTGYVGRNFRKGRTFDRYRLPVDDHVVRRRDKTIDRVFEEEVAHIAEIDDSFRNKDRNRVHTDYREWER